MGPDNQSIMSHVSIGTNNYEQAIEFYDSVMATIGAKRIYEPDIGGAAAYGKTFPEFWVQVPGDDGQAETANGTHFAFLAPSKQAVHDFWDAALKAGATPDGDRARGYIMERRIMVVFCAILMAIKSKPCSGMQSLPPDKP